MNEALDRRAITAVDVHLRWIHSDGQDAAARLGALAAQQRRNRSVALLCAHELGAQGGLDGWDEVSAVHADVLLPVGTLDPAAALDTDSLRGAIERMGLRAFRAYPTAQGYYANDRRFYGTYELLAELGLPLFFHMGNVVGDAAAPAAHFADPCYVDNVAADLPGLQLALGGLAPQWLDEGIAVALSKPNVRLELTVAQVAERGGKVFDALQGGRLGARCLLGSGACAPTPPQALTTLRSLDLPAGTVQSLVRDNAVEWLELDRDPQLGRYRRLRPASADGCC